jgi:hypothetical protein
MRCLPERKEKTHEQARVEPTKAVGRDCLLPPQAIAAACLLWWNLHKLVIFYSAIFVLIERPVVEIYGPYSPNFLFSAGHEASAPAGAGCALLLRHFYYF